MCNTQCGTEVQLPAIMSMFSSMCVELASLMYRILVLEVALQITFLRIPKIEVKAQRGNENACGHIAS